MGHLTPPQEKEELQKCFEELDKNGDGKLSPEELIEAYTNIYGNNAEARYLVARIIKEADNNFSGKIDYTGKTHYFLENSKNFRFYCNFKKKYFNEKSFWLLQLKEKNCLLKIKWNKLLSSLT